MLDCTSMLASYKFPTVGSCISSLLSSPLPSSPLLFRSSQLWNMCVIHGSRIQLTFKFQIPHSTVSATL
jgi:hypothetical protein